tara:strand:- start:1871 stop:3130 length:1260 start_codon:yes stop_codon:yes gene_type:complete
MSYFFEKNILNNLYIFLPVVLITGPFLPDLFVVIISLYFVIGIKNFKDHNIFLKKFYLIFIFFYFSICLSSSISDYNTYSLKSSVTYLRFGLFAIGTYFLISKNEKIILGLAKVFLIVLFVLFIDSIFQFIFGFNLIGLKHDHDYRITSFFGKDEILGSYIARLFPFIVSVLIYSEENFDFKLSPFLLISLFLAASLITILSAERTSFVLLILSMIMMFLTCNKIRKSILYIFMIVLFSLTSVILSSERVKNRMFDQTINQLGFTSNSERLVIFSKTYEGHYMLALKMFKQKPILGYGPKTFRKFCSESENYLNEVACTTHPHNVMMQLLAETGIIGSVIYLSIFCFISFNLLKIAIKSFFYKDNNMQKDYLTLIYIFYFINLFPIAPSGNFFNNWLSTIYYFPLGYMIFLLIDKKKIR